MRERARNLRSESELHLNNRCLFQLRGKVLGGASSINGMVYMRGQPQDFDRIRERFANALWRALVRTRPFVRLR
jgi:choline dehydrogenase